MIGAALRKIMFRRGIGGVATPSKRRKSNRAVILCVLLAGLLVMRPEPARAICCPADVCVPSCDIGTVLCSALDIFSAFIKFTINMAVEIVTLVQWPVVDAAHGLGSNVGKALHSLMLVQKEAARP